MLIFGQTLIGRRECVQHALQDAKSYIGYQVFAKSRTKNRSRNHLQFAATSALPEEARRFPAKHTTVPIPPLSKIPIPPLQSPTTHLTLRGHLPPAPVTPRSLRPALRPSTLLGFDVLAIVPAVSAATARLMALLVAAGVVVERQVLALIHAEGARVVDACELLVDAGALAALEGGSVAAGVVQCVCGRHGG